MGTSMNMLGEITVRDSTKSDILEVRSIYNYYVLHTIATLEEETPSVYELMRRRADVISRGFPHLVAEAAGKVIGYSYASAYRVRSAYRFTVEDSIYVKDGFAGVGIGKTLLAGLILRCEAAGLHQMVAVIGDENLASIRLHEHLGFRAVGTLRDVGFKFGRSVDTVLLQRGLGRYWSASLGNP